MGVARKGACQVRWGDNTAVTLFAGAILTTGSTSTPETAPGDQATWQINAGDNITLTYADTAGDTLKAAAPNKVTIIAYYETGTGTIIRTFQTDAAPPTSITFWGTDTGDTGGSPRAGMVRIYMKLVKDNAAGGVGNYNVDTDGNVTVGSITTFTPGAMRSNFLVDDITVSAYPAGIRFAYGTAGDENFTVTTTQTQRFADRNIETVRIDTIIGSSTQQVAGTVQEVTGASLTQSFTANNTFLNSNSTYGARIVSVGNSLLLTSELWALPIDNGANVTQDSTTIVRRDGLFVLDPRITINSPTFGQSLYNRGEIGVANFNIQNGRSENLSRSMTVRYRDGGGIIRGSVTDSGTNYDLDYTIGSGDGAAFDFTGALWTIEATAADVATAATANAFRVSSKLILGSNVTANNLVIGTNFEIYNRGETVAFTNVFLGYARGVAFASKSTITQEIRNTSQTVESTIATGSTSAAGLLSGTNYVIGAADTATADAVGSAKHLFISKDGNSTDNSANEWTVSSLYLIDNRNQLSATLAPGTYPNIGTGSDTGYVILGDVLYTWAAVSTIRSDATYVNTAGNAVTMVLKNPGGSTVQTTTVDAGPDATNGSRNGYTPSIAINPASPAGDWTVRHTVTFNGNTATVVRTATFITPLSSNLKKRIIIPTLVKPGQTVTAYVLTEVDDVATVPQTLPQYRIGKVTAGSPDVFSDLVTATNMLSVVTGTAVINGALYRVAFTAPTTPGTYEFFTVAQLNGNKIRDSIPFRVAGNAVDPTGLFSGPGAA